MRKTTFVQQLEAKLRPFGFEACHVLAIENLPEEVNGLQIQSWEPLKKEYRAGWKFIETVQPPITAQKLKEYEALLKEYDALHSEIGLLEAMKRRHEFIDMISDESGDVIKVHRYTHDPFEDILAREANRCYGSVGYRAEVGSRGGYLPHQIKELFFPAIAQRLNVPLESVRLPYVHEFIGCLERGGVLESWPGYFVSEWLEDKIISDDRGRGDWAFHNIIHSLVYNARGVIAVNRTLAGNHDTGSDRYNPFCGFRVVIDVEEEGL